MKFLLSAAFLTLILASPEASGKELPTPAQDGWISESFSDAASQALSEMGKKCVAGKLQDLPEVKVESLRPERMEVLYNGEDFKVRRWKPSEKKGKPVLLAKALQSLCAPFAGGKPERVKFKVFSVQDRVTRQYAAMSGHGPEGMLEMNATWLIRWGGTPEAPVPEEIRLEAFEEVTRVGGGPLFADATDAALPRDAGVRTQYLSGTDYWRERVEVFNRMFKFAYCGLAIGDADGDGLDDLFSCQNGGLPDRLFLRNADGSLRDATEALGLGYLDATTAALFLDLDNDGDQDLVASMPGALVFFENRGGAKFEPRVRSRVADAGYSLAAADFDGNGYTDVYVCRYHPSRREGAKLAVPVPYFHAQNGGRNYLVRNNGRKEGEWLAFDDATDECGLNVNNSRFSFAAVWDDLDGDGDLDLFVANDFGRDVCYVNDLVPGGRAVFREVAEEAGAADGGFGMSAATGDFDRDGCRDLCIGNMFSGAGSRITTQKQFRAGDPDAILSQFRHMARGNTLLLNRGAGALRFADVSESAGCTVGRWAWGTMPADINNDGWEDILVANGYVTGRDPDDL
ncbi:MAG TPA: VCBS repeat-containing protein [Verrucomicrobiales bacterium]|nr:VCBS repeat-containing protein [Verrucomicrobiales bacterium]